MHRTYLVVVRRSKYLKAIPLEQNLQVITGVFLLMYCRYKPSLSIIKVAKHYSVKAKSEASLKRVVANRGPVSVADDASHLQFYKSGNKRIIFSYFYVIMV